LFLHGFGGSANSEKFMVKQAEKRGVTKDIIQCRNWLFNKLLLLYFKCLCLSLTKHNRNNSAYNNSGSANSEKFMVKQAEKRGVTKDIITAYVSKDGAVTFKGKLRKDAVNPTIL
jgi:uncharacterized alpha/beta hydrolase family protein